MKRKYYLEKKKNLHKKAGNSRKRKDQMTDTLLNNKQPCVLCLDNQDRAEMFYSVMPEKERNFRSLLKFYFPKDRRNMKLK